MYTCILFFSKGTFVFVVGLLVGEWLRAIKLECYG